MYVMTYISFCKIVDGNLHLEILRLKERSNAGKASRTVKIADQTYVVVDSASVGENKGK